MCVLQYHKTDAMLHHVLPNGHPQGGWMLDTQVLCSGLQEDILESYEHE